MQTLNIYIINKYHRYNCQNNNKKVLECLTHNAHGHNETNTIQSFTHNPSVCLPVCWGANDNSVNQDAMRHLWEGRISQLQLCNDAKEKQIVLVKVAPALL